jgi:diguanylate cyclase (GGDEF)-like protein
MQIGSVGLSNWPFALKMTFCPVLATMVIVGMGLHGILAADHQAALIRDVVRHDLTMAIRLSENTTTLQEINSGLYRLTTLQASRTSNLNVTAEIESLVAQTSALADHVEAEARDVVGEDENQSDVLQVASEIRIYRDAIDVFGSMLEIDFPSAVEIFRPFDTNAKKVLALIKTVADRVILDASSRAQASSDIADRIRVVLVIASVAGFLLLFGTAAVLTRATVLSVKRIAKATEQVAQGSSEVDIEALARSDELGTIVRSLAVFQANVSEIAFLAHHDPLTRLPNRILFEDRIEQALASLDRDLGFAVLCLDLDRFKVVNDTLGHPIGDALLQQVADRLKACVREGDSVARLGGDEFAIILRNMIDPAAVDGLATRIIEVIGSGYEVEGHQIDIGTSIGVALAPADGSASSVLMKNADTALYGSKANARGTCCFYEDSMNAALQQRREIEVGLRQAIALDQFQLHYQPLVNARSRIVSGFEALIRWQHPERGLISADTFIPVAESSGLIGAIGEWVVRRACLDAATWPHDIKVAVNLSPSQFKDKSLVDNVRAALAVSGLPANRLEIEITESVLLHHSNVIMEILHDIKDIGVQISMDDFGTGFSSLNYLRNFPFDKVKIDQSFVRDLPDDINAIAIVRAIVALSVTFGMSVTAEGVETEAQADQLERERCTQLQGYLFSKPVPAANVSALIQRLSNAARQPTSLSRAKPF